MSAISIIKKQISVARYFYQPGSFYQSGAPSFASRIMESKFADAHIMEYNAAKNVNNPQTKERRMDNKIQISKHKHSGHCHTTARNRA